MITPVLQTPTFRSAFQGVLSLDVVSLWLCTGVCKWGGLGKGRKCHVVILTWHAYMFGEGDINNMQYPISGLLPRKS